MRLRSLALLASVAALTACQGADPLSSSADLSPVLSAVADQPPSVIPNQYIVVFKSDVRDVPGLARGLAAANGGRMGFTYETALKGFSVTLGSAQAAEAIARNPNVAYVEQDQVVQASTTQTGATWGLDRVDQRNLPLSSTFTYNATASNVWAYIIDTGINSSHSDFLGRQAPGYTAILDGRGTEDCDGHGTHVAGTVGGTTYGVAKGVTLVPVRVLDCTGSGSWSGVIAGVNWVAGEKQANPMRPMVANMSLGGGASTSVDNAVAGAISKGVTIAVAAGNSNQDACRSSPARVASAITVGATTSSDARASYSNFGSCLDLFAPGSSITSAWIGSTTAIRTISGTSMASPHVAGVAALFLARKGATAPAIVRDSLVANATVGKVTSAGRNSPNRLLFTNY